MLKRRGSSDGIRKARYGAFGRRFAVAGAVAALSCGTLAADVAFSAPAGATTSHVACGDVYGPTGLVAAINAANAGGGGTINLAGGCTYTLTAPNIFSDGLPVVTSTITINGLGSTIARSQAPGTASFRIFEVDEPGNLTLNLLTVAGGSVDFLGGGIFVSSFDSRNAASLTLNNSQVVNNNADVGGGIFNANSSTLRMSASHINNNTAGTYGGLDNQGTATLSASQVNNNTANAGPGGGIGSSGSLTASSTQINGNAAAGSGGGLSNSGTLNLMASLVTGNTASSANGDAHGGGINNTATSQPGTATLTSTSVSNNTVSAPNGSALGGGIYNFVGTTTLRSSAVIDNVATGKTPNGGGIFVTSGSVTLMTGSVFGNGPNNCAPPHSVPGCIG
ncbi:MAG TPA: hypothetical protein VIX85_10040 [Acidimicrobiales bacterium]